MSQASTSLDAGYATPTITGNHDVCLGGSTLLGTGFASAYQWSVDGVEIWGATSQTYTAVSDGVYSVRVALPGGCFLTSADFPVTFHAAPQPTVIGPSDGCPSPGVALSTETFATYQWIKNGADIPGATGQTYVATAAGDYSVRVTDPFGCSGLSAASYVYMYSSPTPTIDGSTTGCAEPGVALTTGYYSNYQWNLYDLPIPGATSQAYQATQTGWYTVTVGDWNGCRGTSNGVWLTLNANPAPTISGPSPACDSGALSTQSYAGYQWLRNGTAIVGATGQSYFAPVPGSYTVRVANSQGCFGTSSAPFVVSSSPVPSVSGASSGCGSVGLFTDSFASYQWYLDGSPISNATQQTLTVTASGLYSVRVTSSTGCATTSPSKSVTVHSYPTPLVTGGLSGCATPGVALTTGNSSAYQWIKDGLDLPGATLQNYTAGTSGTYSVRVTDASGCVGTSPGHAVTIWPNPAPTVSGPGAACSAASLSTGVFSSYQWRRNGSLISGATGQSYFAFAPGSYSVSVTDGNGCSGSSAAFVVHAPPVPTVAGPASGCGSVPLSAGAFSSYQWNQDGTPIAGATAQVYAATTSGRYSVTVTDGNGCEGTSAAQTVTVHPLPVPTVTGAFFNTCPATTVALTAPAGYAHYQWSLNGSPIAGATGSALTAGVTGNYSVAVEDVWRCVGTSEGHPVFVDFCAGSEVSPAQALFPAQLRRDGASPTGYYLYFQRLDTLDGYNVYEGTLGIWYSHAGAAGNACAAYVEDLLTGEMRAAITPSEGDHYYLVTAFGGGTEGPSGFRSDGSEIDPSQSTCGP